MKSGNGQGSVLSFMAWTRGSCTNRGPNKWGVLEFQQSPKKDAGINEEPGGEKKGTTKEGKHVTKKEAVYRSTCKKKGSKGSPQSGRTEFVATWKMARRRGKKMTPRQTQNEEENLHASPWGGGGGGGVENTRKDCPLENGVNRK